MTSSMKQHTEVIIVGAGMIGCALAYFLRKAHREVLVLERDEIGQHASGAAAGLIAPLGPLSGPGPFADLVLAGFHLLPALIAELEALSGISVRFARPGALRVVRHPTRLAHLQKRFHAWQPLGLQLSWLSGEEARRYEPHLAPDICAAVYAPQEAHLSAPHLVQACALAAQKLGARFVPRQEVVELVATEASGRTITQVRTRQGDTFACEHLVLATGAWTAIWNTPLQTTLPISPLSGQLASFSPFPVPLRHLIFGEGVYLAPREQSILVGATKEERGFETHVTDEGISWLHHTATRLVPALAQSRVERAWAGLRPRTTDARPIVDWLPGWENVLVVAGHNSVGLILSGITGQGVAQMLTTGQMPALFRPWTLQRFAHTGKGGTEQANR